MRPFYHTYPTSLAKLTIPLEELIATVKDLCYLAHKTLARSAYSAEADLAFLASWHLLPDLPDPALIRTLIGHTGGVSGCAISPEGGYIVSASFDNTLKVWDAHTGVERHTLRGHTDEVEGCAISPLGDSIVSASEDNTLKVWDVSTGACLCTLYVNGQLNACAFHPDGEHIVAAGAGGMYFLRWVR